MVTTRSSSRGSAIQEENFRGKVKPFRAKASRRSNKACDSFNDTRTRKATISNEKDVAQREKDESERSRVEELGRCEGLLMFTSAFLFLLNKPRFRVLREKIPIKTVEDMQASYMEYRLAVINKDERRAEKYESIHSSVASGAAEEAISFLESTENKVLLLKTFGANFQKERMKVLKSLSAEQCAEVVTSELHIMFTLSVLILLQTPIFQSVSNPFSPNRFMQLTRFVVELNRYRVGILNRRAGSTATATASLQRPANPLEDGAQVGAGEEKEVVAAAVEAAGAFTDMPSTAKNLSTELLKENV